MTIGQIRTSLLIAGMLVASMVAPAHAISPRQKCQLTIPKAAQKYLAAKVKLEQKCKNAGLKDGSCATPDPGAVSKLETKLDSAITKVCSLTSTDFRLIGFPGPCSDANPGDDFTLADLKTCIKGSHDAFVTALLALEYDATVVGPLGDDLKCQAEVAKQSAGMVNCLLKSVSKCRDAVIKGKSTGIPDLCATQDPKTMAAIAKCEAKLTAGIANKCTAPQIATLKVCTPDQSDPAAAATCLIAAQELTIDTPAIDVPADLIDFEYATRGGLCGDNIVNHPNEECDFPDDSACPGQCGTATTPDGYFACLCKNKPRMVVVHDADADTDNGWTGQSSDGDVVQDSGYIVDLYDCVGGLCNAGPHCSLPPHSACNVLSGAASGTTGNSICTGLGQGVCRKERTATGPRCHLDPQKKCAENNPNDAVCNGPGDFCETRLLGAPVGQAAGGVAVCNVSTISEDVVGTVNILTGAGELKVRQRAVVYNPITQDKPCPVCGGFCAVDRERCSVDGDCAPGMGPCVTELICSDGARQDRPCRAASPFGGALPFFGVTSMDCPPNTGLVTLAVGLDVNTNPRGTNSYSLTRSPGVACTALGFNTKTCVAGTSEGRPCTVDSECPGGTCQHQCFCSSQQRPNGCNPACVGGTNDADLCSDDTDCPGGGFCHPGDCREDPLDTDSDQEGICTSGPNEGLCSTTSYKGCTVDADCQPPACPYCQPAETCAFKNRACFVNSHIVRTGTAGFPTRSVASVYCVAPNSGAINASAGFGGPGALIQNETLLVVP